MRPVSLTRRLTVFFTLGSVALLVGLGALFMVATDRHFMELDEAALQARLRLVQKAVAPARDLQDLHTRLGATLEPQPGDLVAVHEASGRLVFGLGPAQALVHAGGAAHAHEGLSHQRIGQASFHLLSAGVPATPGRPALALTVGLSTAEHDRFMRQLWWQVGLYMLGAAALAAGLGWLAARQGLQPLRWLTARLEGITARQLNRALPVDQVPQELAGLTGELNAMLRRLQADFERLSDFSADLAHELRTPISNLLTQTQVALAQPRSVEALRDILASNAEEFERLARTVSDMLLLAKMEHGIDLPHRERFALRPELEALLEFHEAWAEERGLGLRCEGDATVRGDRLMLRRALSNLLSNALRHATPGSTVQVAITAAGDAVTVAVTNAGDAIAPDDQARLFDRFFRADPARRHADAEGAGLGLAITQAIARAHGGQVGVRCEGGWTTFFLQLPATAATSAHSSKGV